MVILFLRRKKKQYNNKEIVKNGKGAHSFFIYFILFIKGAHSILFYFIFPLPILFPFSFFEILFHFSIPKKHFIIFITLYSELFVFFFSLSLFSLD
jgi:hypothetical protein